ncbi:MAG: DUF2835 family protein [Pseudomonadota bacterium]
MALHSVKVHLAISADEYVRVYAGSARNVLASSSDGQTVRFPAHVLRPFVLHDGIFGNFVIRYQSDGKFFDIRKTA